MGSLPEAPSGELKVFDAGAGYAYPLQHVIIMKSLQNPRWIEILPLLEIRSNGERHVTAYVLAGMH